MLVQDSKKLEVKDKKVLLVGIARSGVATAKFLVEKGAGVVLTDRKPAAELTAALAEVPVDSRQVVAGGYPEYKAGDFDFLVVSPGVPLTVPPVRRAFELGVPVYSELELAYRFAASPIVAVTGTNGKTTTTTLLGGIFKRAGKRVCVGGNIGLPLVLEVEKYGPEDIIVAEVSSFQLECVDRFKPRVSLILNFTPDHLDRHGTMAAYLAAKARIFANQEAGDFTVLNYDDPEVAGLGAKTRARVIFFSRRHKLKEGVFVEDGQITVSLGDLTARVCPVREVLIKGAHNLENALAAAGAATVMGVAAGIVGEELRSFRGVAHRLEPVAEINGVQFINDSKGTNPDATIRALEAYDQPVILLAGGRNKGSDFAELASRIKARVRSLVIFGECRDEIRQAVEKAGFHETREAASLEEAVKIAAGAARPGEIVLLSPACASWDMFKNFEERGERFKEIVFSLRR